MLLRGEFRVRMAKKQQKKTFASDFRTFFVRGLAILLPSVVTLALLLWAYTFLRDRVAEPINHGVRSAVIAFGPRVVGGEMNMPGWYGVTREEITEFRATNRNLRNVPDQQIIALVRAEEFERVWSRHWYLQGIGFVVAILLIYLAGLFVGNYLGRRIYARIESWAIRLPVIKQVYPNVKQVTDFLLGGSSEAGAAMPSNRVVVVEYPRKGIWTVGLMTGESLRVIEDIVGEPCVTIFIPSSPTPFTGYTITVPAKEVYELPISLDEAIRFVVSGGVLVPGRQQSGRVAEIPMAEVVAQASRSNLAESPDDAIMGRSGVSPRHGSEVSGGPARPESSGDGA